MIQSKTPGQASKAEVVAYLRDAAQGIADRISMPAQDHGYNCLSAAADLVARLRRVEERCAFGGHTWIYQNAVLLLSPLARRRVCFCCGLQEIVDQTHVPDDAQIASDASWRELGGYGS